MSEVDARKLSKKEKKALAFRAGKGKKKSVEDAQDEVPEQEDLDQAEEDRQPAAEKSSKDKKRKREEDTEVKEEATAATTAEEAPKKKKRQRGGMNKPKVSPGEDADGKPKLVLFIGESCLLFYSFSRAHLIPFPTSRVLFCSDSARSSLSIGNLPFKVTMEQIKEHFTPTGMLSCSSPRARCLS